MNTETNKTGEGTLWEDGCIEFRIDVPVEVQDPWWSPKTIQGNY